MKKIIMMILLLTLVAILTVGCKKNNNAKDSTEANLPVIGIAKLLAHPALNAVEQGIQDELKAQGVKVKYDFQNANADMSIIASIANKYKSDNNQLLVGIGTPIAVALANAINDRPIVFAAISDPVNARLVPSLDKGGKNVTGVSDAVDIEDQINKFRTIVPFTKLGFIYTSSEDNSVGMKKITEEVCKKLGIEFLPVAITNITEIKSAAESLVDRVDAFYVVTDNNLVSSLSSLTSTARAKKIPVFSADPSSSLQFGGVLYTAGSDYYTSGRAAGKMIIDILNGKKTEDIPVKFMKTAEETMTIVDKDVVKELGVTIPENLLSTSTVYLENGKKVEKGL